MCVVNCDKLRTISRVDLTERIGELQAAKVRDVRRAVGYALGWEELIDP
jgi:mRNA-degrading endonuclease toxin of MazEF toxin-antitoxin module